MAKILSHGPRHLDGITDPTAQNSAGNTNYNNLYPRFATASNGDVYAVWQQCNTGDPCDKNSIFVRKYDASGQSWGAAIEVSTTAIGSTNGERPDIALDSNDLAHIVWIDNGTVGSRTSTYDVIYCTWDGVDSAGLSTASTASTNLDASLEVYECKIAISNNLPYVVYRGDGANRDYEVYLTYRMSSSWVADSQVSDGSFDTTTNSGQGHSPSIVSDSNNIIHVAWYNSDSSYLKIHYRKLVSSTNVYGPISALSVCGATAASTDISPTVAVSDACKVYISWVGLKDCSDTSLGYSIYYSTIDQSLSFTTPAEITSSTDFDGELVFSPQIITRPGLIGTNFNSKDASFAIVWKSGADVDNSDSDNDILIQRFDDCGGTVGSLEALSEGAITDGFNIGATASDGDSSEPAITTSDSEIFIGWQEKPTGVDQVYNLVGARVDWGTDGATGSGACSNTHYDYCVECIENTTEDQPCGINSRGTSTRTCVGGLWGAWGSCVDPDVCLDNDTQNQACGLNSRGTESRTCTTGQWGDWGTCTDPDECTDNDTEDQACGLNNRGTQSRTCTTGSWDAWGTCTDPDVCTDDTPQTQVCGLNNRGLKTRICTVGQWPDWSTITCVDPDECVDSTTGSDVCGFNDNGIKYRTCIVGSWAAYGACTDPDECEIGSERIISCGTNSLGTQVQICQFDTGASTYQWNNFGSCEEPPTGPTGPTGPSQATDIDHLLPPTYGSLGIVYIDKPLGAERSVCFDEKATIIEVIPQTVYGEVGTSVVYDMKGNIASRNNDLKYLSDHVIYETIDQTLSPPVWQTGPCLTSCTDEVPIGYSDYYFNVESYDNNTFDIEYCLTDGEIDTFVLTVTTTDFKTSVVEIDKEFGTAIENGWDIKFRSLSTGFAVIYGHGTTPIKPAGLSTLIRVYLDNSIIEQNPDNVTDAIIVFPVFMKLGNTSYKIFDKYISDIDTVPYMNLIDPAKSSSKLPVNYYPWSQYITDSSALPYTYTPTAISGVDKDWQTGSSFLADLQHIGTTVDPRFREIFHYIADSFERVIKDYPNDAEYETIRSSAIEAVHYFKTSITTWASFMRVFPISDEYFDFTWDQWHGSIRDHLCIQNFTTRLFCKESVAGGGQDQIEIVIYYTFPMMSASGIEIDFSNFAEWMAAYSTTSIVEAESWTGGLKENNFLQAYSNLTSKFAAVYGAKVSSGSKSSDNPYLAQKGGDPNQPFREEVLTKIIIDASDTIFDEMFAAASIDLNTQAPNCEHLADSDGFESGGYSTDSQTAHSIWMEIIEAIDKDLLTARVVTNQNVLTRPSSDEWTGNAYSVGTGDIIDVKDYLTILMISVEGESVNLTSKHIEETIKLPYSAIVEGTESTYKTVQDYYNLPTLDLSGISYKTVADATCDCPWVDSISGEHILSTIDANNDGVVDIYDVVAIRNLWTALDQYPLDVEIRKLNVIPSNICVPFDVNVDLLMPDECSNFRVKPKCFSKVWFSDVIAIKDEQNPVKYLLEVSYSVDALDINDNPIEDFSGVQFKVEGLSGDGIIGTENGSGTNAGVDATAVKALQWSENILPSVSDSFTRDTYIAFSTNGKYISKGKNVLCYLSIRPESLPDSLEWMDVDSVQDFIVTNKFKRFKTVEGIRISHPLANLKFKSHHTDELLIYESIGLKISNFKITANRSFNNTTSAYSNIVVAPADAWTGDVNDDSVINVVDLNYALGLAARREYDVDFDSNGSGIIDIVDVQAINHYINNEIFNFGTSIVSDYCCLCVDPEVPAVTVIDFNSESKEISIVGQRTTREITLSGEEFGCHSTKRHTGGIGVYWNPIDNTDYYIVYRQSVGEPAIAIIGAAPGVREHSSSFDVLTSGGPKTPVQISPTLWIDYPPVLSSTCEDYITGEEEIDCSVVLCDIVLSDTYCIDLTCPDNYSLLLHLNDDALSTGAIVDSSQYNIQSTVYNNAHLDSSILKFGTSSCAFDGVEDYLTIDAASTELQLDADFTIDFWARFQDTSSEEVSLANPIVLFSSFDPTDTVAGGDQGLSLESYDGQGTYYIRNKENDTYDSVYIPQTAVSTLNTTDWFHFALIRYNGTINLYVNGVKSTSSIANTYTFNHSQYNVIYVGKSLSSGNHFEGNIDEFRIVKGEALWTDDFSTVSGTSTVPAKETVCSCETASESEIVVPDEVITAQIAEAVAVDPNIHVAEEFEYWVVAVNKCNEAQSNKETGSVINCRFGPTTEDFSIEIEVNQEYSGEFKASYQFAARPLGNCVEASGDCIPLWTYAQNSNTGNGKKGISDKGGLVITSGRMPTTTTLASKDEISFTYKPKENYIGKDTFKYTATILDPNSKEKPSSWCKSESIVTVYVKPASPSVTYSVGDCQSGDEDKATLNWTAINGAESYKVYKDGVLKTTISSTGDDSYTFEESVSEWDAWLGDGAGGSNTSSGTTSLVSSHSHKYFVDGNGYGWAIEDGATGSVEHAHEILSWIVQTSHDHIHSIIEAPVGNEGCVNDTSLTVKYSVSSYYTVDGTVIESPQTEVEVSMPCCVELQGPNLEISLTQKQVLVLPDTGASICPPDNYSALLHFDENDQSGNPIDSSSNTISCTYNGNAVLSEDSPDHFPVDSSVYFDGVGDYVTIAQDSSLILSGDFTIDFWAKFDDVTSDACFFSSMDLIAATTIGCELRYFASTNLWYFSQNSGDGSGAGFGCGTWTFTPSDNLWYHVALVRNFITGNALYVNGIRIDHQAFCYGDDKFIYDHNNNGIDIGRSRQSSSTFFKGYIDEFRIVNGEQIWTSDFSTAFAATPPGPYCPEVAEEEVEETEEVGIRETTITWSDLEFVDTYNIHRRGPYETGETPAAWNKISTITSDPVSGIYTFTDLLNECYGCNSVFYDYYITSSDEINGESVIEQNIKQVEVQCTVVLPIANDKAYITKYNTNIAGETLSVIASYSDVVSYSIVTPPDEETGALYDTENFSTTGEWSFNPDPNFAGGLTFEWEVLDSCGNTDRGITTIVVEFKSSDKFVILDGNELVEQQDVEGVRKIIDGLEMVPGQIGNINSVSALRKRDNAYKLTKSGSVDIIFEEANHGCTDPAMFNYSSLAEVDDGSCIPYIYGCVDENYQEYDTENNTICVSPVCSFPDNYSLLLHFNDDGTGNVVDSAPHGIPIFADGAALNSSVVKFGASSCLFDGVDDYIAVAAIANNAPNPILTLSGNFTIDFWAKSNDLLSTQTLIGSHDPTSGNDGYQGLELERFNVGNSETYFWLRAEDPSGQGSINYQLVVPTAINAVDWFHYALVRYNGEIKLYINGTPSTFGASNTSVFNHASFGILYIGVSPKEFPTLTNHFDGYMDEFRIVNGQALWVSDFSANLPASELSAAGCVYEGCTPCETLLGCTSSWADNYDEDADVDNGTCYRKGCTEEWADNHDENATINDGSCYKYGCTYSWADNFDEDATIDNNTCTLAACNQSWADNFDLNATSDDGSCYKNGCTEEWADNHDEDATINDGSCYKFGCVHEWADNHDEDATNDDGSCYKYGCSSSWADNYNPSATIDDGSCVLAGCTGTWAENYNGNATSDNGTCYKHGCTETWADNFDQYATIPTDICYKYGCTEEWADNHDEVATINDGTCYKNGCTEEWADNHDLSATVNDGSCYKNGCTQVWADNFDEDATIDDGSCLLGGCTDPDSDNFDPNATHNDGSCFRCGCMETWADNYNPLANIGQGDGGLGGNCYFQGLFHFNGADEEVINLDGWANSGTEYATYWTEGWGSAKLDTAYSAYGTSSFNSAGGSAILHGSTALLNWAGAFSMELRFATIAGENHSGVEAFFLGHDRTEPGYVFYAHFEQLSSTRQRITVSTNLSNGNIVFDSDSTVITGNMVSMPILDGSNPSTLSAWQHLAITRSTNGVMRLFIDGVEYGYSIGVFGTIENEPNGLDVGGHEQAALATSWIDELRIHNGLDHSSTDEAGITTFPVPTEEYINIGTCFRYGCTKSWADNFDPLATRDSSESAFSNSGSSSGGLTLDTDISDIYSGTANVGNMPVITTEHKKFGGGSVYFDGSGGHVHIHDNPDTFFEIEDFTIDFWVRFDDVTRDYDGLVTPRVSVYEDSYSQTFILYRRNDGSTQYLRWYFARFYSGGGSSGYAEGAYAFQNDTWYHIAMVRSISGQYHRLYLDGTLLVESGSFYDGRYNNKGLIFGASSSSQYGSAFGYDLSRFLKGYIDEIRIVKGANKYPYSTFILETDIYCKDITEGDCVSVNSTVTTETSGSSYKLHGFMFDISNESDLDIIIEGTFSILGDNHNAGYTWPGGISVYYIQPSVNATYDVNVNLDTGTLGNWVLLGTDTNVVSQGDWNSGVLTPIDVQASFTLPTGSKSALYITALDLYDLGGFDCTGESGCLTVGDSYAGDSNLVMYAGISKTYDNANWYPDPGGTNESRLFRGSIGYRIQCTPTTEYPHPQCFSAEYLLHFDDLPCYLYDCAQEWAENYDVNATIDDGSCTKTGCTGTWAENYDFEAIVGDGTCYLNGCTDSNSDNYDANATIDDGTCYRTGCTDSTSDGFDSLATVDSSGVIVNDGGDAVVTFNYNLELGSHIPVIISTNPKFGNGTVSFDGSGGFIHLKNGHTSNLYIKDGDAFTIDFWVRFTGSSTSTCALFGTPKGIGPTKSFRITFDLADATPYFTVAWTQINDNSFSGPSNEYYYTYDIPVGTTINSTTWYHIALTRDETTNALHFFLGGAEITKSGPWTSKNFTANEDGEILYEGEVYGTSLESRFDTRDTDTDTDVYYGWSIGHDHTSTTNFIGEIDEFRFANKENVYSSGNFTPATTEITGDSAKCPNGWFVWHFDDGVHGSTGPFIATGNTGVYLFSDSTSDSTIPFSGDVTHPHISEDDYSPRVVRPHFGNKVVRFDGVDDNLKTSGSDALLVKASSDFTLDFWVYFEFKYPQSETGWDHPSVNDLGYNKVTVYGDSSQDPRIEYYGPNYAPQYDPGEQFIIRGLGQMTINAQWFIYSDLWRITGFDPIQNKKWYHIALTRKSGLAYFFINGERLSSWNPDTAGPVAVFETGITFGYTSNTDDSLRGYLDELRLITNEGLWTESFNMYGLNGPATGETSCNKSAEVVLHFNKVDCYNYGCTEPLASNYDATATIDDGSCTPSYGCLDSDYEEYVSPATVANVLIVEDDFNSTNTQWTFHNEASGSSNWHITGGSMVQDSAIYNNTNDGWQSTHYAGEGTVAYVHGSENVEPAISDLEFRSRMMNSEDEYFGLIARYNSTSNSYYLLQIYLGNANGSGSDSYRSVAVYRVTNTTTRTQLAVTSNGIGMLKDQWYDVTFKFIGSDFTVTLDGVEILSGTDSETPLTAGTVGLFFRGSESYSGAYWDHMYVINLDSNTFWLPSESCVNGTEGGGCIPCATLYGCTDNSKFNYNPNATDDDGSCIDVTYGCLDSDYNEYDSSSNTSCVNGTEGGGCFPCATYYGCTDSTQDNYNAEATDDNGSCYKYGCTESTADNYDANATINFTPIITNSGVSNTAITINHDLGSNDPIVISDVPKFGTRSLHFDGTDGYISLSEADFDSAFTIDFWVKLNELPSHTYDSGATPTHIYHNKGLFSTNGGANLFIYFADLASTGNAAWTWLIVSPLEVQDPSSPSTGHYIIGDVSSSIDTTSWFHVALTRDSSNGLRLFFNGTSMGTNTTSSSYVATDGFLLGTYVSKLSRVVDDDFNSINVNWVIFDEPLATSYGPSNWTMANGGIGGLSMNQSAAIGYGNGGWGTIAYHVSLITYDVEFKTRLFSSDQNVMGLVIRYDSTNNYYYLLQFCVGGSACGGTSSKIYRVDGNGRTELASVSVGLTRFQWHDVIFKLIGSTFTVTLDGTEIISMSESGSTLPIGGVGLFTSGNYSSWWDYVDITSLDPELVTADVTKNLDGKIDEFRYIAGMNTYPTDGTGFTTEAAAYPSEDLEDGGCSVNVAVYHLDTNFSDSGPNELTATGFTFVGANAGTYPDIGGDVSINTDAGAGEPNEGRTAFGNSSLRIEPSWEGYYIDYGYPIWGTGTCNPWPSCAARASYLTIPSNPNITHFKEDEEFTIDLWVRFDDVSGWASWNYGAPINNGWAIITIVQMMSVNNFHLTFLPDGPYGGSVRKPYFGIGEYNFAVPDDMSVENDTWYHLAVTQTSEGRSIYFNGVRLGTTDYASGGPYINSGDIRIGADQTDDTDGFSGYIDEIRIVKGRAMWTGDSFEVPTSQYTCNDSYPVLLHFEEEIPCIKYGCTKTWADNYDAASTIDDGSCTLNGCTTITADNYSPYVTTDDGSCVTTTGACTYGIVWHFNDPEIDETPLDDSSITTALNNSSANAGLTLQVSYTDVEHVPTLSRINHKPSGTMDNFGFTAVRIPAQTDNARIDIPDHAKTNIGTDDFTIDFWVRMDDTSVDNHVIKSLVNRQTGSNASSDSYGTLQITIKSGDIMILVGGYYNPNIANNVAEWRPTSPTLNNDTWYHIALTRDANLVGSSDNLGYQELKLYIDGVLIDTRVLDDNNTAWVTGGYENRVGPVDGGFSIGYTTEPLPSEGFAGYIDELRVVKGYILTTFALATEYACNEGCEQMILHFDDAVVSPQTFADACGGTATATAGGAAQIVDSGTFATPLTGSSASVWLEAPTGSTAGYVQLSDHEFLRFDENTTIDFWVNFDDVLVGYKPILEPAALDYTTPGMARIWMNCGNPGTGTQEDTVVLQIVNAGGSTVDLVWNDGFVGSGTHASGNDGNPLADATWHHIAFVFDIDNNNFYYFRDGVNYGAIAWDTGTHGALPTLAPGTAGWQIGRASIGDTSGFVWEGYIDDFRVTKGTNGIIFDTSCSTSVQCFTKPSAESTCDC